MNAPAAMAAMIALSAADARWAGPVDPGLLERLRALDARVAEVRDLSADFEQLKHTPLTRRPIRSTGRVAVRGPQVRWDTLEPSRSVLALDEASVRIYYPEDRELEEYPLDEGWRALTASPLPRLEAMVERFDIVEFRADEIDPKLADEFGSGSPPAERWVALELVPKEDAMREHVERVRVLVDASIPCIARFELTDPSGDRTAIVFSRVRTNTGLSKDDASLVVPEGTRVSRPLGEGAPR